MEAPRIVTTSWDDGEQSDLRLADVLRARGMSGTFYVPITPYLGRPALSHVDLRALHSEGFEIGAHGYSHTHLWKLSQQKLASEINPCKPVLEDILGAEVRMFCYPRGRYDSKTIQTLKQAGYLGARTVRMLATGLHFDPFEMPTTVQIRPHPRMSYFKNIARGARKFEGIQTLALNMLRLGNWVELGMRLFDFVLANGGIWHLYGHSQEIEELGLWKDLERMLDYVANRKGVDYLPNWKLIPAACAPAQHFEKASA